MEEPGIVGIEVQGRRNFHAGEGWLNGRGRTNAATETYTFTFRTDIGKLTAIRLEVLPDDKLNGKGPGRSVNGNFVMTGIRISVGDGKDSPLKIRAASADFSQKEGGFDVKSLLTKGPGWAISPEFGKPHHAVFELTEPLSATGKDVTVQLQFNSQFASHQFGRFRVLATDSATPHDASGMPANISAILKLESAKRNESQKNELRAYYRSMVFADTRKLHDRIGELKKRIVDEEKAIPDAMVMQEMPKPRDTFVLIRGASTKGRQGGWHPGMLRPAPPRRKRRIADLAVAGVARASADRSRHGQSLLANVLWHGLVKTAEDFGTQGSIPHTPSCSTGWPSSSASRAGTFKLITLIVTSATYRQSSAVTKEFYMKDPENRLLARGPRFRLQAEFLRDQVLAISGLLNDEVGGKSVSPYQPTGLWEELMSRADGANWTAQTYTQSHGKDLYRRTMYTFWKRTCPPPSLATLDAPDREVCVVRRSRTNTPLQALVLMNDPTYVKPPANLPSMMKEGGATAEDRIAFAFKLATAKSRGKELAILKRVFEATRSLR